MSTAQQAALTVDAPMERVRAVLLDPLVLPEWNPAGGWELRRQGDRTAVVHGFEHTGPLAAALSRAYRGVAELRLTRLAERLRLPGRVGGAPSPSRRHPARRR